MLRFNARIPSMKKYVIPLAILLISSILASIILIMWKSKTGTKEKKYYLENHLEISLTISDGKYKFSGNGPMWDMLMTEFKDEGTWAPVRLYDDVYCADSNTTLDGEGQFVFLYTENGLCIAKSPLRDLWLYFNEESPAS